MKMMGGLSCQQIGLDGETMLIFYFIRLKESIIFWAFPGLKASN